MTPKGRIVRALAFGLGILVIVIAIYLVGRGVGTHEINAANNRILQYQNENQKLGAEKTKQMATINDLQNQLKDVKAKLEAIMPAENTYSLDPNHSLIVADGHLTLGLIGSPENQRVNININGKTQLVPAGDVINVSIDPSTNCRVEVQSFDMFKALVTATCAPEKPQ
jgi:cell division protein FtsB